MEWHWPPTGARAVIATRHGKERVILSALASLQLDWQSVPGAFDSDRFGTFTRDIPRAGSQMAAARAKAEAALALCPNARIAIASEGAFGADPAFPIVPGGFELVLLLDHATGLELVGRDRTWDTNFAQRSVKSIAEAEDFAERCGFPEHGIVVMTGEGRLPLVKDNVCLAMFRSLVAQQVNENGQCWLETDMRAHRNPRRMAAIARAAQALAAAACEICPECRRPGFVARKATGRPCRCCGEATIDYWQEMRACDGCGHCDSRIVDATRSADPGLCPSCNP